jgi:serine/threonine protein kinase
LPLPDGLRISCLTDTSYRRYLLSSTIKRGTYGKLKYALPVDDPSQDFAVKELRLKPCRQLPGKDPLLSRQQRQRTPVTAWHAVQTEWTMSHLFGGPFAPHHGLVLDSRAYLFFDIAADTLMGVISSGVPAPCRALLARYVAREVGGTLLAMQQYGALHLDVSPNNILMQKRAPYFALADFGTAQQVARAPHPYGECSTYCSPEAILRRGEITSQADLWSLGASLLTVLKPPKGAFLAPTLQPDNTVDRGRTAQMLLQFFEASAGRTASADPTAEWLRQCGAIDGPLTDLLLRRVLVLQPKRSSVADFLRKLGQLPPLPRFGNVDAAMEMLAGHLTDTHRQSAEYTAISGLRSRLHQQLWAHVEGLAGAQIP